MTLWNEFNHLCSDSGSTQFFCGCNTVVSVHYIVFKIDLVEHDRPYGPASQHDSLDAFNAIQLDVALGSEIVVKVQTFSDTADNRIKRDTGNSPVNSVESAVTVIVFAKAFHFEALIIGQQFSKDALKADHELFPKIMV
jgi:hypothetical protein